MASGAYEQQEPLLSKLAREVTYPALDRADLDRGMEGLKLWFCMLPPGLSEHDGTVRFERDDGKVDEAPVWIVEIAGRLDRELAEMERERDEARRLLVYLREEVCEDFGGLLRRYANWSGPTSRTTE